MKRITHNPYQNVDWDTYTPHRAELHCHTTASDGQADFGEMIEAFYAAGCDCLAITDHGAVDRSWTKPGFRLLPRLFTFRKHPFRKPAGLTEERLREISEGVGRDGRGMLRVPFGTEHSPGGGKMAHVCSWFCDVPSAAVGKADCTKAVRRADRAGALCVINHPTASMKNWKVPTVERYGGKHALYADKLQRLFEQYPSLLGIELQDARDRKLWDILLGRLVPLGRGVLAIATSDAHDAKEEISGHSPGWVEAMLPENTVENFRKCLEDGAFFAVSRYVSFIWTPELIAAYPGLLPALRAEDKEHWTPELLTACPGLLPALWEEDGENQPDELDRYYYKAVYFNRRPMEKPMPAVTKITAEGGVISIKAKHCDVILWVSDGKYIASGDTLTLADCEGLGAYVRAELWGPGGSLHTQPFLLQ